METINKLHVEAKENQTVSFHGLETTFKVLSKSVNGSAAVLEHTLEPKCLGAPLHKHTTEDEIIYVIQGTLSIMQDDEVETFVQGQYITLPRQIFHTYWNPSDIIVRFIRIFAPGNFSNYFAEMATYYHAGELPDFEKIAETALYYGLEFKWEEHEDLINKYGLKKYIL